MKSLVCGIVFFMLFSCASNDNKAPVYSLDEAIELSSQKIVEILDAGTSVAVVNFQSKSENFSEYVIEETIITLGNQKKLKIVDRGHLEAIRKEIDLQYSGEVSDESLQAIGRWLGAQEIICGQLTDLDSLLRFRMFSINVETAERKAGIAVDITKTDRVLALLKNDAPIAAAAPPKPQKTMGGDFTEVIINQALPIVDSDRDSALAYAFGRPNKFKFIAMADRLDNIYSNGDFLNFSVYSERNCYIKVFTLDANGDLELIYPMSKNDNAFIRANSTIRIPDYNKTPYARYKINIGSGFQHILVAAYDRPYTTNHLQKTGSQNPIILAAAIRLNVKFFREIYINGGAIATTSFEIRSPQWALPVR